MSAFDGARDGVRAEGNRAKEELWKDSSKGAKSSTAAQRIQISERVKGEAAHLCHFL